MKNEKKLKGYKIVWTCDFCGEEFRTKKESDKHELTCKKNKNREILLRIKVPDKQTIFVLVSIFLGIYLFTFAIVNSYAKGNGLEKKYLTNPLNWFSSEVKNETTPTPTPTSEITPTSTPKPKTQTNNTNTNTNQIECIGPDGKQFWTSMDNCKKLNQDWGKPVDYITDCSIHSDCGGGTKKMGLIECNNMTCCQYSDKSWHFINKKSCDEKQNSGNGGNSDGTYTIRTPQGQEKVCKSEGMSDIGTYMKLMTQYLKEYNATGSESSLDMGIEAEKKYYEAIARYCTP